MAIAQHMQDKLEEFRSRDARAQYKDSYRLLCCGIVIAQTPARLGADFAIRGLEQFRDHLQAALRGPEAFEFVGADGRMTAAQYLAHHEKRLEMTIADDFEIVEPGPVYPLAKGKIC